MHHVVHHKVNFAAAGNPSESIMMKLPVFTSMIILIYLLLTFLTMLSIAQIMQH
jgi:hypothetical protein